MGNIQEITEQPNDPLGGTSGEKKLFNVRFMGKSNNPGHPFTIANELVACAIGQSLGLNLPAILPHKTEDGLEFSLCQMYDFAPFAAQDVAEYVQANSREVHGAIVFDLFIANNDRSFGPQRFNIEFDSTRRLLLIDHGNACYYRNRNGFNGSDPIVAGIPRLDAVQGDILAMHDMARHGDTYFRLLNDWGLVEEWFGKLQQLPDYLLDAAVDRIPAFFARPTREERDRLRDFLIARKRYLLDHIVKRRSEMFPSLPEWATHA